jgi:IS5 family transposase
VLRCALLKQHHQLSYQELAFHLEDSASFRAFARLPHGWSPQKSVLHRTIRAIRAETAAANSSAMAPTKRSLRARPKTSSTPFASHQAMSSSRANPESARNRMLTLGQRARIWPALRSTSSLAPAQASRFERRSLAASRCLPQNTYSGC